MHLLNRTLEKAVLNADGRYLNAEELYGLQQYVQSYKIRLQTYQNLRDVGEKLVIQALQNLAETHPDLIRQHGVRCKFDMTEVLRYIALSVLRDDEIFFKEQMVVWLDTILLAHKRTGHCVIAYRQLQTAIAATLPTTNFNLTRPYLDVVINSLQTHF